MMALLVMERGVCDLSERGVCDFVGFDVKTQEAIDTYYKKKESVLLRNCNLKKGQNSETEILVNQSTKIEQR